MHTTIQQQQARRVRTEAELKFPHHVECHQTGFAGLEMRKKRSLWLVKRLGPRGSRWDYFIRSTGGSTMCFAEASEAVLFKLTWGGNVQA